MEGELLWLDVDTIIREKTDGKRSLETFLQLYSAPSITGPITKTYTRADIERLLDEVAPYDWHADGSARGIAGVEAARAAERPIRMTDHRAAAKPIQLTD
jgi:predicted metalloprotease with PDZ domain